MYIEQGEILNHISAKAFHLISEAADELGIEAYVIGGYVRDIFLHALLKILMSWPSGAASNWRKLSLRNWKGGLFVRIQELRYGAGEGR